VSLENRNICIFGIYGISVWTPFRLGVGGQIYFAGFGVLKLWGVVSGDTRPVLDHFSFRSAILDHGQWRHRSAAGPLTDLGLGAQPLDPNQ